jgi:hypothetical protein
VDEGTIIVSEERALQKWKHLYESQLNKQNLWLARLPSIRPDGRGPSPRTSDCPRRECKVARWVSGWARVVSATLGRAVPRGRFPALSPFHSERKALPWDHTVS